MQTTSLLAFVPMILVAFFYLVIVGVIIFLIYTWVQKFIRLKEEQNNILRDIAKKLENNQKL